MRNTTIGYRETHSLVQEVLTVTAVLALLVGAAVYLLDRDWADTMLLEPFMAYQGAKSAVFGVLGGFLPALLHAYAIPVLIIAALRPWPWTGPWVCLLWFTIASTLEWLQSDAASAILFAADGLPDDMPLLGYLKRYAVRGQFDYVDLFATGVGCLTALAVTIAIAPDRHRSQA
jgi:hypothetical protein